MTWATGNNNGSGMLPIKDSCNSESLHESQWSRRGCELHGKTLGIRFKSLHIRGSFVVQFVYPLLIHPSEFIEIPNKSHICRRK